MSKIQIIFEGKELTQTKFNEIERYVLKYFEGLWSDIRKSINVLRKNNPELLKSEVCLGFIGADSLSRFREIITTGKEDKNNEDRFREWFDVFVLDDSNEIYKKYKKEINCDSATAWKLRNSLLHFYGLPKSGSIGFSTLDRDMNKKFKDLVSKNHGGKQVIVVNPYKLVEAILNGFLTQGEVLIKMIKGDNDMEKEIYAKGIVRCYEIIQNEGSVFVPLKNDN